MFDIGKKVINVVGISTITSNDVAHNELGKLWETFFKVPIKEKLGNLASSSIFSVYSAYENGYKDKYKVTIGYAVDDLSKIPEDLTSVTIPVGNYKDFKSKSPAPEDIVAVWQTIWATDPEVFQRNFVADFELYDDNKATVYIGYR